MALFSLLFLVAISLCLTRGEENQTFFLGLPPAYHAFATRDYAEARLVITTASTTNISYTVTINNQLLSMGSVNVDHSQEVDIHREHFVSDTSFERRHKGITVKAAGSISVMAYTVVDGASLSAFNVLPYKRYLTLTEYKYYGISAASTSKKPKSLMLLVGSDNNTVVQLKPSVNISLPADIQKESPDIIIKAGTIHRFTLHKGQTVLLRGYDISGTEIISNNPLTVISGHECAKVPINKAGCSQILVHVPPTVTWGKNFILQPFCGRSSGQLVKVISSNNETYVQHSCTADESLTVTELSSGNTLEFDSPSNTKACMISSNKPILVAQLSKGRDTDGLGDPAMMIVPPLEQFQSQQLSIKSLPKGYAERQYINIIALAQNFNKSHVHLNDKPIDCDWATVYATNSTDNVLAYTCTTLIHPSDTHTVTSTFPAAVMVYGFTSRDFNKKGYAYNTGSATLPLNAVIQVKFSVGEYQVSESDQFVTVEIWRMDNIAVQAQVIVTTASGTAMSGIDFVGMEKIMTFEIGEMHKRINISIINDEYTEDLESFSVIVHPLAPLSSYLFHQATVQIVDNDDLKIGFSTFPDPGGRNSIQVGTFSGKLPADVPALVYLKIQFLTSDMASVYSQHINISNNVTSIEIPCSPFCDKENSTVIGILELIDSEQVNKTHIQLSPSFTVLHVAPTTVPIAVTQPQEETPIPLIMTLPIQKVSPSMGTIILVGFLSSFVTLVFSILISLFCCYLSYKYGKEYGYRYNYTTAKKIDRYAIETKYFVQTVNDTSF